MQLTLKSAVNVLKTPAVGYLALILVLLIGCILRIYSADLPSQGDEGVYMYQAKEIFLGNKPYTGFFMGHPPLNDYLTALSFRLFGVGIWQGKLVNLLFSLASMPLIFIVARRFYGFYPAFFSTLLFSLSPAVISFTKDIWLVSAPLFFSLLSSYYLLVGMEEDSRRKLFFAGLSAGIAMLCKFTSIVIIASILAYMLLRRAGMRRLITFLAGFFVIFTPFIVWFYSPGFINQIFIYHLSKVSYSVFDKIKLTLYTGFGAYSLLMAYGLFGLASIWANRKELSEADIFYSINAIMALLFVILIKYAAYLGPALYLAPSIYAFAILSSKSLKYTNTTFVILFVYLFLFTVLVIDVQFLSCFPISSELFLNDARAASEYVNKNSDPADFMVVDDFRAYFVAFLSDRKIVPQLLELNPYRFTSGLEIDSLKELKGKAKYSIMYDDPTSRDYLKRIPVWLSLGDDSRREWGLLYEKTLYENTSLVARFGNITIYRNNQ